MPEYMARRDFIAVLAAALAALPSELSANSAFQVTSGTPPDPALLADLVAGNHILVRKGVILIHGHLSARHNRNPNRYFIARAIAPELVTAADIMELDLDSNAIDAQGRVPYQERFIHGEIYRARPDVMAVVHAHTPSLLSFATSDIPLRSVYQQATFIGDGVPVFKNGENGDTVVNAAQGRALVKTLGNGAAVLMHGHGEVVVGSSIPSVVGRCIELDLNARVYHDILTMGGKPAFLRPPADAAARGGGFERGWDAWIREERRLVK